MEDEQAQAELEALLRERDGLQTRLDATKAELATPSNPEHEEFLHRVEADSIEGLKNVAAALKAAGHAAKPPAKRTATRANPTKQKKGA
jgi:hypothetical protein